jgi:predicted NBD/HSP70 family sugar kinase
MTIAYGGRRCRCGALGCLEAYVGAEAVLERYREAGGVVEATDDEAAFVELLDAVGTSEVAATIVDDTVGYLAAGVANLVNLVNPERIVLGGCWGAVLAPLAGGRRRACFAAAVFAGVDRAVRARQGRGRPGRRDPADAAVATRWRRCARA